MEMNLVSKRVANAIPRKKAPKSKKKMLELETKIARTSSLLGFFLVWEIITLLNGVYEWFNVKFLPSPIDVVETFIEYMIDGSMWEHIWASLYRTLLGFALGVVIAILLGVLISSVRWFDNLVSPVINMVGPIPVFAFLPMFIIWFGVGELSKIVLIAYATFLPLLTYTIDGIKNTNPVLIRSAKSLGANDFQLLTKVILKSALPNIFTGMKVSLGLTFSALVVAELMGASTGLGYMIQNARNWFKLSDMFLAAALIGIEYSLMFAVIAGVEKRLFKWKKNGVMSAIEK
ncbi:MAG: ABC transporter permease [Clostridia bacterium]